MFQGCSIEAGLFMSVYRKHNFLISQPKHMLWVTQAANIEHPKHMLKLMGNKICTILPSQFFVFQECSIEGTNFGPVDYFTSSCKVRKQAKNRNRYNQVPHLTQNTNGKVTNSQKTSQTRAKRSALSQQVATRHQ